MGHSFPAHFNIAPTASAPIIRLDAQTNEQECVLARWGLVPSWAKSLKIPPFFNARADKLNGNKVFGAVIDQRCLVPMTGFYEWSEHDKQPYYIHLAPERLFYVAGLWNRWQDDSGNLIDSFSVITTRSNKTLADIHHRMPVILDAGAQDKWLNEPIEAANEVLLPSLAEMDKHKVQAKFVNNARNNTAQCLEVFR